MPYLRVYTVLRPTGPGVEFDNLGVPVYTLGGGSTEGHLLFPPTVTAF